MPPIRRITASYEKRNSKRIRTAAICPEKNLRQVTQMSINHSYVMRPGCNYSNIRLMGSSREDLLYVTAHDTGKSMNFGKAYISGWNRYVFELISAEVWRGHAPLFWTKRSICCMGRTTLMLVWTNHRPELGQAVFRRCHHEIRTWTVVKHCVGAPQMPTWSCL